MGAYLSFAGLVDDLGSTLMAKAYAIDSQQLAEQAGNGEQFAWATDTLTGVLRWTDRICESINAALKDWNRHPLAVRPTAAQGHARQR